MIADHMINYKIGCDRFAWNWMCMIILFGEKQEQFKVYNYEIIIIKFIICTFIQTLRLWLTRAATGRCRPGL